MLIYDQHPKNKSIEVGIIGIPNVGKSSLINEMVGMDLSIVTPWPQTTRNRFHCVATIDHTEMIFTDTPGIIESNQELIKRMMGQTKRALEYTDLILLLIDPTQNLKDQWQHLVRFIPEKNMPIWPIITKSDLLNEENKETEFWNPFFEKLKNDFPNSLAPLFVSTKTGENIHVLTGGIADLARPGRHLYPDGDLSNKNERFFVSEFIREQTYLLLKDELPYETAVVIDSFDENTKGMINGERMIARINASILVNRDSQRPIVIGQQGQMIKNIVAASREKIEKLLGGKVDLRLHVKSSPKWISNNFVLEELGLPRVEASNRVWRKNA